MKHMIAILCEKLYRIKNRHVRKNLRRIIAACDGDYAFSSILRRVMVKYHGREIGVGTYGPCFDPEQTWTGFGNLTVGKFTSIASGVCMYTRNHPYWKPSTSPLFYNAQFIGGGVLNNDIVPYGKLTIGNDVWIGQYAVILPSCKHIGDGSVIGAGSIVTKDIPDYAVVAGNPAKVIKYRYTEAQIQQIKATHWWDWDVEFLEKNVSALSDLESLLALAARKCPE